MLLSFFPRYFIMVYYIIPTFRVESIGHYSESLLFWNKCTKAWWGHCDAPLSWRIFCGPSCWENCGKTDFTSQPLQGLPQLLRVLCPRSCPFPGCPHPMTNWYKNIMSQPPWQNTEVYFSFRVPHGISWDCCQACIEDQLLLNSAFFTSLHAFDSKGSSH